MEPKQIVMLTLLIVGAIAGCGYVVYWLNKVDQQTEREGDSSGSHDHGAH